MSYLWENRGRESETMQSARNDLDLALEAGGIGLWILDLATGRIGCNATFRESLGVWAHDDVWLASVVKQLHSEDRGRFHEALERAVRGGAELEIELRTVAPDGNTRWLLVRGRVRRDEHGTPLRMAGTILDITGWKQTENALRTGDRRKDEFLATLAHELRNPLAAVRCAATALKISHAEPDRASATELIERQVSQFIRLIDDLQDVSMIKTGMVRLKKSLIDVRGTIALAIEDVQPLLDEKKHDLIVSLDGANLPVEADPARLEQIILNLLTNAAKYTDPGGRITLSAATNGQEIAITVGDNGIGIPPEKLPEMFELFKRGEDGPNGFVGGLGVGLAIAAKLTNMHGGTLSAGSAGAGRGCEFTLRLPAARLPGEDAGQSGTERVMAEMSPHILTVVDSWDPKGETIRGVTTAP
jgi:PAS domain S-box-containing protein